MDTTGALAGKTVIGVSETVTEENGNLQTVVATLPTGSEGMRFVHLEVTRR